MLKKEDARGKCSMEVYVRLFTTLREIVGEWQLRFYLNGETSLRKLIDLLSERYGEKFRDYVYDEEGKFRDWLQFFINGVKISNSDVEGAILRDGDVVAIIPPVGGG